LLNKLNLFRSAGGQLRRYNEAALAEVCRKCQNWFSYFNFP